MEGIGLFLLTLLTWVVAMCVIMLMVGVFAFLTQMIIDLIVSFQKEKL